MPEKKEHTTNEETHRRTVCICDYRRGLTKQAVPTCETCVFFKRYYAKGLPEQFLEYIPINKGQCQKVEYNFVDTIPFHCCEDWVENPKFPMGSTEERIWGDIRPKMVAKPMPNANYRRKRTDANPIQPEEQILIDNYRKLDQQEKLLIQMLLR